MRAKLLLHRKFLYADGLVEIKLWQLPERTAGRPHGLKYSLFFGRHGRCLVRYDNERGKGDHRHVGNLETTYRFRDVNTLIGDFLEDVEAQS